MHLTVDLSRFCTKFSSVPRRIGIMEAVTCFSVRLICRERMFFTVLIFYAPFLHAIYTSSMIVISNIFIVKIKWCICRSIKLLLLHVSGFHCRCHYSSKVKKMYPSLWKWKVQEKKIQRCDTMTHWLIRASMRTEIWTRIPYGGSDPCLLVLVMLHPNNILSNGSVWAGFFVEI